MENNWKIVAEKLLDKYPIFIAPDSIGNTDDLIEVFEEFGNLIFEATKKECADRAKLIVTNDSYEGYTEEDIDNNCSKEQLEKDKNKAPYLTTKTHFTITDDYLDGCEHDEIVEISKESILNINKPNL